MLNSCVTEGSSPLGLGLVTMREYWSSWLPLGRAESMLAWVSILGWPFGAFLEPSAAFDDFFLGTGFRVWDFDLVLFFGARLVRGLVGSLSFSNPSAMSLCF